MKSLRWQVELLFYQCLVSVVGFISGNYSEILQNARDDRFVFWGFSLAYNAGDAYLSFLMTALLFTWSRLLWSIGGSRYWLKQARWWIVFSVTLVFLSA